MSQPRILLVYNHWEWSFLAILSLLIRIFTYGPNHAAILLDGQVHEMVGSSFWWTIRKLLRRPVSYEPNHGCGYKLTPYDQWLVSANREVIELAPLVPIADHEISEGYGFLDLPQKLQQIVRTKWFPGGQKWDGVRGTRLWKGTDCTEYVARRLGRDDGHTLAPGDLQRIPELQLIGEFTTTKK